METISLKMEETLLQEIDRKLMSNRYSTRTEFIRDAIRDKLSDLDKEEMLRRIASLHGSSKRKTSDEDLHRAGEKAFEMLERKFKAK
jgi:metal-responsive CopG/Arc/MetJ family transcriptional regulator